MFSAQSSISGAVKGTRAWLKFTAFTQKTNYDMQVISFLPRCDVTDTSLFFPVSLLVLIILGLPKKRKMKQFLRSFKEPLLMSEGKKDGKDVVGKQPGGLNEILHNFGPKQNQSFSVSCISSSFIWWSYLYKNSQQTLPVTVKGWDLLQHYINTPLPWSG